MSDHVWAQDHLASYLAGGLSTADRLKLQEHAAACPECADALAGLRDLDRELRGLFAASQPPVTLEDRTIRVLRSVHAPTVRRRTSTWPIGGLMIAAALLLLVGVGAFLKTNLRMAATLETLGESEPLVSFSDGAEHKARTESPTSGEPYVKLLDDGTSNYAAFGQVNRNLGVRDVVTGLTPGGALTPDLNLPPPAMTEGHRLLMKTDTITAPRLPVEAEALPELGLLILRGNPSDIEAALKIVEEVKKTKETNGAAITSGGARMGWGYGGFGNTPAAGGFAGRSGATADGTRGKSTWDRLPPGDNGRLLGKGGGGEGKEDVKATFQVPPMSGPAPAATTPAKPNADAPSATNLRVYANKYQPGDPKKMPPTVSAGTSIATTPPPPPGTSTELGRRLAGGIDAGASATPDAQTYFDPNKGLQSLSEGRLRLQAGQAEGFGKREELSERTRDKQGEAVRELEKALDNKDGDQIKKADDLERDDKGEKAQGKAAKELEDLKAGTGALAGEQKERPKEEPAGESAGKTAPAKVDPKQGTNTPPAQPVVKKIIIRSGDIEFEIDSFDAAQATIFRIIAKTPGGFVATVNSEKLANGKMRGTVVVRTPPEALDDFVLTLRQELGKVGELKGQRIGSTDITKQYTDLEGELRAARTMEERYLKMIAEAKGALKDLLAVEKDLGVWRTKIEKLEGELRYYGNLASLSTLSISLTEKEIRTAASLKETERVNAGIEVEEVEKAYQDAQTAIHELKGRIMRAEMKQHAAGQFNAILVFELAPESAGLMRDRLRQLGNMVRLEIDRVQQVEGTGTFPKDGKETKVKRGDTVFNVSLYNLANVAPRETNTLTIVAEDVPAAFRKLREAVGKLRAQVRNANLQEQDRTSVAAQLDVDIRRADEATLQTALGDAGEILNRKVERRAEADNVTDAKVKFLIRLIATAAIEPRETVRITVAVGDVPAAYQKLQDAVLLAKTQGHLRNAVLQEGDKASMSGQVDFDVQRAEIDRIQKVLAEIGELVTKRIDRSQRGDNVTDTKVLYQIRLVSETTIEARQVSRLSLATADVPAAYRKLYELVQQLKGQVRSANLQEADRQNISATLEFTVRRGDEAQVQSAITDAGEVLSRQVDRKPESESVTDSKVMFALDMRSAGTIAPRKTFLVELEATDVEAKLNQFNSEVGKLGGRIADGPQVAQPRNGRVTARVVYDVPLPVGPVLADQIKRSADKVNKQDVAEDSKAPEGKLAIARIYVTLASIDPLVPRDEGIMSQLRQGLSYSVRGLLMSGTWLLAAVVFLLPWVLLVWVVVRLAPLA